MKYNRISTGTERSSDDNNVQDDEEEEEEEDDDEEDGDRGQVGGSFTCSFLY